MEEALPNISEIAKQSTAAEAALRGTISSRIVGPALSASVNDLALAYSREMERMRHLCSDMSTLYSKSLSSLTADVASATRAYQRLTPDVVFAERACAQLHEQMKDYTELTARASAQLSRQTKGIAESARRASEHLHEQMKGIEGSAARAMEQLRRDATSFSSALAAMRDIRLPDISFVKSCLDHTDFVGPLKKLVAYAIETENASTICNTMSVLGKLGTLSSPSNIRLNTDGTVSIDGQVRSMEAVEEAIERVVDALVEKKVTPELADIKRQLEQMQPDSTLRKIVVGIVISILGWIICTLILQPMVGAVSQMRTKANAKTAVRAVRETLLLSGENVATRATLRIVVSDILPVNAGRRHRSQIVGWLYPGDVVLLVDKRKGWSLVEFRDQSGQIILTGWVRSKYLCRI